MSLVTINVPSIVCDGCVDTITKAIKNEDGDAIVNVDMATKQVEIQTSKTLDQIKQVILDVGHLIKD